MTDNEIVVLLEKLKKDQNWLLNFILESCEKASEFVHSGMSVYGMLCACSRYLKTKILQELRGIERDYETRGYPAGFDSLPAVKIPPVRDDLNVFDALKTVCREQGIDYSELTPVQRLFLTHYRCPNCKLVPLYKLDLIYPRRLRCGICGHRISLKSTGKYGRLRSFTAKYTAKDYRDEDDDGRKV